MGTRVDFYVGRGENAEWLGSYPFDGYPDGVFSKSLEFLAGAVATEQQWRAWVENWFANPERASKVTTPDMGWPWPWETSATTDYAYAWDDGVVYGSCFGDPWFRLNPDDDDWGKPSEDDERGAGPAAVFPSMSERKAVTYGPRSGLIVISHGGVL